MIKKHLSIVASIVLCGLLCHSTFAELFVQPAGWYVDYSANGFSEEIGPAVEVGSLFGASNQHAVSLAVARVPWELSTSLPGPAPTSLFGVVGDGHLLPVLGSYRYYFGASAARWRFFAGAAAGATKISGRIETRLSGVADAGDVRKWAATFAGTIGVAFAVRHNVSVELAYRYMHLENVDYSTALATGTGGFTGGPGQTRSFAATEAHIASLGLSVRF
jgi:hypothetical protein